MIAAVALAALSLVPGAVAPDDPNLALPARWDMGDFATPFEWGGHQFNVYADAVADGMIARSLVVVDGMTEIIHPLTAPDGAFYWLTDATELPDGRLLVAALEVKNRFDLPDDGWAFEVFDTDLFVVTDPTSPQSWAVASRFGKLESGWWDLQAVEFDDLQPGLAYAKGVYCVLDGDCRTRAYSYTDVVEATVVGVLPESGGVFAPVQTADGWFGYSWDWEANTATLWRADGIGQEWVEQSTVGYVAQTHAHGLNVVDGRLVHRFSVIGERPVFEEVTL